MESDWRFEQNSMKDSMSHLLETGIMSDCKFAIGDNAATQRIFPAHKFMLTTASPVFETMFHGSLPENTSVPIEITDIEAEPFDNFLRLIYGKEVKFVSVTLAIKVYFAGEKYMIEHIKKSSFKFIQSQVKIENVSEIYDFAERVNEQELTTKCLQMFRSQTAAILDPKNFSHTHMSTISAILDQDSLQIFKELVLFQTLESFAFYKLRLTNNDSECKKKLLGEFRELAKKIRFRCMSAKEFSCIALSKLLPHESSLGIMECLEDENKMFSAYPDGFTKDNTSRCKRECAETLSCAKCDENYCCPKGRF